MDSEITVKWLAQDSKFAKDWGALCRQGLGCVVQNLASGLKLTVLFRAVMKFFSELLYYIHPLMTNRNLAFGEHSVQIKCCEMGQVDWSEPEITCICFED